MLGLRKQKGPLAGRRQRPGEETRLALMGLHPAQLRWASVMGRAASQHREGRKLIPWEFTAREVVRSRPWGQQSVAQGLSDRAPSVQAGSTGHSRAGSWETPRG